MADERIADLERAVAQLRQQHRQQAERNRQQLDRERQRADREAEGRRDAEAFAVHLQQQLVQLKHDAEDPQTLRQYLRQIGRLHLHLSRLLPFLPEPQRLTAARRAEAATEAARGSPPGSSPKTTTAGTTSIHGKYYPLRVRPWTYFAQEQSATFGSLLARLGDEAVFPPQRDIRTIERAMQKRIHADFADTESFHNHARTSTFLDHALEDPSSTVLEQYFAPALNGGRHVAVFFDVSTNGARAKTRSASRPLPGDSTAVASEDSSASADVDTGAGPAEAGAPAAPRQTRPDCVVMVRDIRADDAGPPPAPRRLLVGEHKPCHALRAADLGGSGGGGNLLSEDCLVRLAIAVSSRKANRASQSASSSVKRPLPAKLAFFAHALAQTYHYMLLSGLEYGYLASGETLTLLRIPLAEPTTLLYHTASFPAVDPKDLPRADGRPVYPEHVTAGQADDAGGGDDALAALAVAQLSALALLAFASEPRETAWVSDALVQLAPFPNIPASQRSASTSPLGLRRRDSGDDDDDDDGNEENDGRGGGGGGAMRRRGRSRARRALPSDRSGDNAIAPSPLRQVHDTSRPDHDEATETADLPFCTQACLLGLARGLPLDAGCPNYAAHAAAAAAAAAARGQPADQHRGPLHAITSAQLCALIRQQVRSQPEHGCTILYDRGLCGAVGCLLKLTALGYGYTFVAKGVEAGHAYRLRRETRIYRHLRPLQGDLVPVHLGLVRLLSPYPFMARFTTLTHMMLLSYTGATLHRGPALDALSEQLGRDLEREIDDAYDVLADWGVEDLDMTVTNATWCAETRRVVKIDFDHCVLDTAVCAAQAKAAAKQAEEGKAWAMKPLPKRELLGPGAAGAGKTGGGDGDGDGAAEPATEPATEPAPKRVKRRGPGAPDGPERVNGGEAELYDVKNDLSVPDTHDPFV